MSNFKLKTTKKNSIVKTIDSLDSKHEKILNIFHNQEKCILPNLLCKRNELCNKFKNMIGLKEEFLETPLIDGYIDESVVTPLDKKTYELFQKEYKTVFRYRGKNFVDLTDKHQCIIFYAKMCSSICGGVLAKKIIPEDKKNNKPASCKYKYDIEVLQKHMDLYGRRKNNFNTEEYDKYFEEHKTIPKSMKPIAQKLKDINKIRKSKITK